MIALSVGSRLSSGEEALANSPHIDAYGRSPDDGGRCRKSDFGFSATCLRPEKCPRHVSRLPFLVALIVLRSEYR